MPARALLLAFLLAALPATAGSPPVWPLDLGSRHLTSNFMERRPGRYHAGLDLKTESRTGFAVRAVEAGHITRVRAEAGAYGRAIYVQGASGRTTVYAHLECFSDRIADLVAADRAQSGVYRVRLQFAGGQLPVTAGEVLGLSGESGTSGPHLHFEVRDAAQRPVNPLDFGFAVADTFAPVISAVTAHLAASPVAGAPPAAAMRDEAGLRGQLPALTIRGPVAFSARITDQSDVRGHVLEPWLIEVRLDGELVYRCRNESFAFGANNQLRLEWCDLVDPDGRTILREHWLFRREGVEVPGREGGVWYLGDQGRGLPPGDHLLEIAAADRAGGRTAVTVPLTVLPADKGAGQAGWEAVAAQVDDKLGGWLTPFLSGPSASTAAERVLEPGRDPVLARTVLRTLPWTPDATARPAPELEGPLWGAFYLAADWPLDGDLRTAAAGAPAGDDLWVFRWDSDEWKCVGPLNSATDGAPWFQLADRGLHAVFRDRSAPWIDPAALKVEARAASTVPGVTLPRWTTVPVAVVDRGTGVADASLRATLDGEPLIIEPDLIRDRVLVTVPDTTAPGRHELRLEATDEAGNTAVRTFLVDLGGTRR